MEKYMLVYDFYVKHHGDRVTFMDNLDEEEIPYEVEYEDMKGSYSDERVLLNVYIEKIYEEKADEILAMEEIGEDVDVLELINSQNIDEFPKMECPHCKEDIDFDFVFCPKCNRRLT